MSMLDAALALIARGLPVISVYPVGPDGQTCHCPQGRACRSAGKHPRGTNWQHRPMRTEAEVRAHWEAHPKDNLGIPTGATSGVFALDIDGEQGKASYAALREQHGPQPATLLANTGGGGKHLLYRMPEGETIPNSSSKIAPGLDIRGDGGFIVAAGSVSSKGAYSWANDLPIADPSPELLGLVRATSSPASSAGERGEADAHNVGPKFAELPEAEQVRIRGWLDSAERGEAARLAAAVLWPENQRTDRGAGWEKITADLCARFGALALAPWSPWTMQDAEAAVRRTVPPAIAAAVSVDAKWSQQWHRGVPAKFPEPRATVADLIPTGAADLGTLGMRAVELGQQQPARPAEASPSMTAWESGRLKTGGSFVLDAPDRIPAIWGEGDRVIWAEGEALTLCGPAGVGKTTLCGQLVKARLGLGSDVLGLPVKATEGRVLYLAMDRPRQIARALRRLFVGRDRAALDERLVVWEGPPLADLAKHPETLLDLAREAGADTVIVDSLKDAAIGLGEDEVGAGYNRARQLCIAHGVDIMELHHLVKRGPNGAKPTSLADVYGSVWIVSGSGSVVLLWGQAGDPIVDLIHLKQPAAEVGPFKVMHDHMAGTSQVWHQTDLLVMAKLAGSAGITAKLAAQALFSTDKPEQAQIEKARRKLDSLVRSSELARIEGDRATAKPTVWTFTGTFTGASEPDTFTTFTQPSRPGEEPQVRTITDTFTTFTAGDLHDPSPARRAGGSEVPGEQSKDQQLCSTCGEPLLLLTSDRNECAGCTVDGGRP